MSNCNCANISVSTNNTACVSVNGDTDAVSFTLSTSERGPKGEAGADATINGYNVVTITADDGIALVQDEDVLTISGENLLSRVDTASVVYGTDENGDQTTYPLADLGKVQDVTVDGTSVVTNSVAELNTMALASTSDYRTSAEQDVIDAGKQDVISDLSTIRSDASAGKTASDTIATYGDIVTHNTSEFATSAQGSLADTAVQPDDLATVATTGSYNDLLNTPTIPTVNDATLTVQKNGASVGTFTANASTDSTINITVPTAVSELSNDSNFIDLTDISATSPIAYNNATGIISVDTGYAIPTTAQVSQITTNQNNISANTQAIGTETTNRQNADNNLQSQIDAIVSSSDVFDIVGTYAELQAYDIDTVPVNDIIKVLVDESRDNAATYYRCVEVNDVKSWSYIGSEGAYYTKSEADSAFVPQTRTVNNKALSNNITLTASDVGALADDTVIPTVYDSTVTLQTNGVTVDSFTLNQSSNKTIDIEIPTNYYTKQEVDAIVPQAVKTPIVYYQPTTSYAYNASGVRFYGSQVSEVLYLVEPKTSGTDQVIDMSKAFELAFSFVYDGKPSATFTLAELIVSSYSGKGILLQITSAGNLYYRNNIGSTSATGSRALVAGNTYDVKIYSDTAKMYIDYRLSTDASYTNISTKTDTIDGSYYNYASLNMDRDCGDIPLSSVTLTNDGTTLYSYVVGKIALDYDNTLTLNANNELSVEIDQTFDGTSANPQSGVAINTKLSNYALSSSLATVATTGSYSDLSNTPTIGNATLTIQKNSTDVGTFTANATTAKTIDITVPTTVAELSDSGNYVLSSSLATVATTGSYNDLSDTPTIPTVNDATLTIQKNGTSIGTFTANQSTAETINVTVPTTVAELSDASNYVLSASLATVATTGDYDDLSNKPNVVTYTLNSSISVVDNTKDVAKTSPECLFVPNGLIMGGTASAAGLVTRGICGSSVPTSTGSATKSNLYINFDGDTTWNPNGRGLVINAGSAGSDLGQGMRAYCAVRGDIVKAWVEAQGYYDAVDGSTVSLNASDELQSIGVIETNASTAIKTWVGTQAEYDAISTKDSNTLYNITDDTDATLTLIEALYPVGSLYLTTASTCPLATIIAGSTWELVSTDRVLQGSGTYNAGDTVAAGLPNITGELTATGANNGALRQSTDGTTTSGCISATYGSTSYAGYSSYNGQYISTLSIDASDSDSIYGNSTTVQPPAYIINVFRRTA